LPYDAGRQPRDGAWVAEITGMHDLSASPRGMRLIVRKERPHPGAQLRFTDIDGNRVTCFATSAKGGQFADLEPDLVSTVNTPPLGTAAVLRDLAWRHGVPVAG
jgi:hypothetical protein